MSYRVLARKWRPRSFADVVGQGHVLQVLVNALDSDRLHHAYLFSGTRGVGKTTLARVLAKCLNCEVGVSSKPCGKCDACVGIDESRYMDLIEVDAASRAKVEETRELMDNVQYSPSAGRYKVYLIDEVHMFSKHSFNALLKTLEEPPGHVKFLLATTEPKKIPITILSRCLQFNLKHLAVEQIEERLRLIVKEEGVAADDAALQLLAIGAAGSMRDALSLLDQAISYGDGKLEEEQVRGMLGVIDAGELSGLVEALADRDADAMLEKIGKLDELAPDYDDVLAGLLAILHDIALAGALPPDSELISDTARAFAGRLDEEDVQLYYQIALNGRRDLPLAPAPRTGFEMTMIRMLAFRPWGSGDEPAAHPAGGSAGAAPTKQAAAPASAPPAQAAAPVAAASAASAPPPAPAGPAQLANNNDWLALLDDMSLEGMVRVLASHCTFRERQGDALRLTIEPNQEHLLVKGQVDRLQELLKQRLGEKTRLDITTGESQGETAAKRQTREDIEAKAAAVESIENDPGARELLDTFNASIDKDATHPNPAVAGGEN